MPRALRPAPKQPHHPHRQIKLRHVASRVEQHQSVYVVSNVRFQIISPLDARPAFRLMLNAEASVTMPLTSHAAAPRFNARRPARFRPVRVRPAAWTTPRQGYRSPPCPGRSMLSRLPSSGRYHCGRCARSHPCRGLQSASSVRGRPAGREAQKVRTKLRYPATSLAASVPVQATERTHSYS